MEERLAELEVRVAFQDRVIQQLNDVVTRHARDLERLTREIATLRQQLTLLAPSLVERPENEPPPPHY